MSFDAIIIFDPLYVTGCFPPLTLKASDRDNIEKVDYIGLWCSFPHFLCVWYLWRFFDV